MTADLSTLEMTDAPIPQEPNEDVDAGLTCSVCGKDINRLYSGRGRKPSKCEEHKTGNASKIGSRTGTRTSGDVGAAVQSLESAYQLIQMGLLMFGAHDASAALRDSIPGLSEQNAKYLATDKDLVKQINKVGKVGGRTGFVISQVSVLAPVAILASKEISDRLSESARVKREAQGDVPFADFASDGEPSA